ncbi:hypothetical protein [Lutibacter maritimus]|uniref:Uncharacterized protein n=1 Tax=Lutibacter maritimus TaxID=593133 RepID=A0A1I6NSH9_9FLAO|nr:hypothetical protein [Lutibacter maritimus]SFS30840.1 hypothetical protein SAMN04488006_0494 [Lutibacter maritimus]
MSELIIYRSAVEVARVIIDEKTILTKKLMNEDRINSEFFTSAVLPIELGDYIVFDTKYYYLNQLPGIEKVNSNTYKYTATFQSVLYDLYNKLLISSDGLSDFTYVGNATSYIQMIVNSMNEISTGWTVGTIDESYDKTIDFVNETCRTALTKVSEAFKYEFQLVGKTIHFKKAIGTVKPYTFQYGRGNGLYSIERRQVDNKSVFTRVYGFGGTKNIPYTYRERAKRLVFEERKLEKNISIFGIREAQFTDDEIYPKRTGALTVTNILFEENDFNVTDSYIEDSSIDFDINDYLLSGLTAKIVFKTGDLTGNQFEIWKYDHINKRIYFNPFIDGDTYKLPNKTLMPKVGDTYTLGDLEMPYSYVIKAEQDLKDATQRFLDENSVPKMLYFATINPKYVKENAITLDAGDLVTIVDSQFGIDRAIRISQVSFPLVNKHQIEAIIADFIPYTLQQLVTKNTTISSKAVQSIANRINYIQNINNISNTSNRTEVTNVYTTVYPEPNTVVINGRKYYFDKGYDNTVNSQILEPGDFIWGNYWDRYTFVLKWRYKGGNQYLPENYDEIETIEIEQ